MYQAVLKREPSKTERSASHAPNRPEAHSAPPPDSGGVKPLAQRGRALGVTLGFGLTSVALYGLLFQYSDAMTTLATETRQGHKLYALVPMAIAFAFSAVHGTFTGRFWDLLGLKAKGY
jgi:hypothetical protein